MNSNQTTGPSFYEAIDAARVLAAFFDESAITHQQAQDVLVLRSFAQISADLSAKHGSSKEGIRKIAALAYLKEQLEVAIEDEIIAARGHSGTTSWADIGDAIGVSRQAAQQKYGSIQ